MTKTMAAVLVSTALFSGGAFAQGNKADNKTADKTAAAASMHKAGEWRASKLSGVNVYNDQNEKIGDISDVIMDRSGKAVNVVIGVGGFLGMGEHYVAIPWDKMKWSEQPVRTSSNAAPANNANNTTAGRPATNVDSNARTAADGSRTTGSSTTATTATGSNANDWYPDHAVYNATKDQLKAMPEFKY